MKNPLIQKRSSSSKTILTLGIIVTLVISIAMAIVIVFAFNSQSFNSIVNISFEAVDIDGKVELYSTLKTGTEIKIGEASFDADEPKTTNTIDGANVELNRTDDYVTFKYKFYNYGDRSYSALLSYLTYPTSENVEVLYSQDNSSYVLNKSIIIVSGNNINEYFIRIKVQDIALDSLFEGDFNWLLEKYNGDQEFSLGAVDYIYNNNTGSYTATYTGAELENNTLYIASSVGSASVTTIGKMATLPANTTVVLEEGITKIDNGAFNNNSGLVEIEIPASLEIIDFSAFANCKNLTTITFPEDSNLKEIKGYAFQSSALEDITLPDSVESIGNMGFYNTKITEFTIPASVIKIGAGAFAYNQNLTEIIVEEGNTCFEMRGKCLIEKSTGRLIRGFNDSVIPDDGTIKIIDSYAFYFQSLFELTYLPQGVEAIENSSFAYCKISTVVLPSKLKRIGSHAFAGNGLLSLQLPASVTTIGEGAFSATNLTTINIEDGNTNFKVSGNCLIEISSGKIIKGFNDSVIPSDGSVKVIGAYSFSSLQINEIIIPESVLNIDSYAFHNSSNLKSITFKNTIGWFYSSSSSATNGTNLNSTDLANPTTAADYLTNTYKSYYWKRA